MSSTLWAALLLGLPVATGSIVFIARNSLFSRIAILIVSGCYLAAAGWIAFTISPVLNGGGLATAPVYFRADGVSRLFFLIMTIVFAGSAVYSLFYLRTHPLGPREEARYIAMTMLFAAAMVGVIFAADLALMWVFVEATTLTSAVLIYTERRKSSLEATWKYVFTCSVGIALAFVGIILLSMGNPRGGSLDFANLTRDAGAINPFWLRMSFVFLVVGFGTKVGVAPVHAWLPDAHSEAPSPVSAMLSGALLNTAFLALFRMYRVMSAAGNEAFARTTMLVAGFASLIIAASFMLNVTDYKRMLAYSSIENMGILFIGTTLGPAGMFAVMLHAVGHSLSKASLFLTAGTVAHLYGSKISANVRGLVRRDAGTGWLFVVALIALVGLPPFPVFLSKFLLVSAFLGASGQASVPGWLVVPFLVLMLPVLFGMIKTVFSMTFGQPELTAASGTADMPQRRPDDDRRSVHADEPRPARRFPALAPQVVMLSLLVLVGVGIPHQLSGVFESAARESAGEPARTYSYSTTAPGFPLFLSPGPPQPHADSRTIPYLAERTSIASRSEAGGSIWR